MYRSLNPRTVGITLDWRDCLPLASANGFAGMDLAVDPEISADEYRDALRSHDLRAGGMGLPVDVRGTDAAFEDGYAALAATAQRAAEVGVTRFATWIPSFSDTLPWRENFARLAARLSRVSAVLADCGCMLGLEYLGPRSLRVGRRHGFIHTMYPMLELARACGPNVGLLLDSWHWHTSLGTVDELLELDASDVVYVHVNDAPADLPIEQQQDLVRELPGATGVIDIGGFLGALETVGYAGPVVAEPFDQTLKQLPPDESARRVGAALQRIWP